MKLEQKLTPPQLVAFSLGGASLLYLNLVQFALPIHHRPYPQDACGCTVFTAPVVLDLSLFLLRLLVPIFLGLWAMYAGKNALVRGIQDERWAPEQLTLLRAQLNRPLWTWIANGLALGALIYILVGLWHLTTHHGNPGIAGMAYFFASPIAALALLRKVLNPARNPKPVSEPWLNYLKPIQSDHWGQR